MKYVIEIGKLDGKFKDFFDIFSYRISMCYYILFTE